MTSRPIDTGTLNDLIRGIKKLEARLAILNNRKVKNLSVMTADNLPTPYIEGSFVVTSDAEACYVYSNGAWVAVAAGGGGGTDTPPWDATVMKTADEDVSSSIVPQNDDELFFTATSTIAYHVEFVVLYSSPVGGATPDISFRCGEDTTERGFFILLGTLPTVDVGTTNFLASDNDGTIRSYGTATTLRAVIGRGFHIGNGGTWRLLWSQRVSGSDPTRVHIGSYLRYRAVP